MKIGKDRSLLYIALSLLVIMTGIIVTSFISKKSGTEDIRAKAGALAGVNYVAVVGQINPNDQTIIVVNLAPESSPTLNYGQWTVTTPGGYNFASNPVGTAVIIKADTSTFLIDKRTMTAKEIVKK